MKHDCLFIYFWMVGYIISYCFENSNAATSCPDTTLAASHQWKTLDSPNFPNKFQSQTQCNWVVVSPSGYRVKIRFVTFYLVKGNPCTKQYVRLIDTYTGLEDGPYCGNTNPPSVISTGKRLRIELESNAVGLLQIYKGFRIQYTTTIELPSFRLRDSGGVWRGYATVSPELAPVRITLPPQTTTLSTRDPSEVDVNNNAAIDALNRINSNQDQNAQNDEINKNNNAANNVNNYKPTATRPRKPNNPNRFRPRPTIKKNPPSSRPTRIVYYSNPSDKSNGEKYAKKLPSGAIAAIAVVAVVIVAIIFFAIFRFVLMRKKNDISKQSRDTNRRHKRQSTSRPRPQRLSESSHRSNINHHHEHIPNKHRHLPGNAAPPTKPHSTSRPKTHNKSSRHKNYESNTSKRAHRHTH